MFIEEQVLIDIIENSVTNIPNLLLSNYKKIGLSDEELIVIIHLIHFKNKGNQFPSISELENRMSIDIENLIKILQHLLGKGYINIDEHKDEVTGIIFEVYNLTSIYLRLLKTIERDTEIKKIKQDNLAEENAIKNVYKLFEQEFGRLLSPIEIELITTWLDKDKYSEDVIIYALKEAVFSNKLNFRYIDSILFEWQKKNIKTIEQIRQNVKKHRENKTKQKDVKTPEDNSFEFYNWLEEKN
ncbi:MAG: DnaD domain protein [Vulcanibacillus sp.]